MTVKEAILKSLEDINNLSNHKEIYAHISKKKYYNFENSKTPELTVSAALTMFIQKGDKRVKRVKQSNGSYAYYLSKIENKINFESNFSDTEKNKSIKKTETYSERDLHILFSSYLNSLDIYSKTIFHEKSNKNEKLKWVHPDIVGIKFLDFKNKTNQAFIKVINKTDTFKLISYELKREINTDYELKKTFFQAVSNSSWANYGYLVAFEISDSLSDEMERLNQAFGIGIIKLNPNPFESIVLFQPKYNELDFRTMDKLCKANPDFEKFIEQTEKLLTAGNKYIQSTKKELIEFCDEYFTNDTEIENYCKNKNIPIEKNV